MSLRHEDDPSPLTPAQQAEAFRLAARLQTEHEARASTEDFYRAAEEVGIERRFLHEAVAQVAGRSFSPTLFPTLGIVALLASGLLGVTGAGEYRFPVALMLGVALGILGERSARRLWTVPALVLAGWLAMTLLFASASGLRHGNTGMIDGRFFLWASFNQGAVALLCAVALRAARRLRNRPQSL